MVHIVAEAAGAVEELETELGGLPGSCRKGTSSRLVERLQMLFAANPRLQVATDPAYPARWRRVPACRASP